MEIQFTGLFVIFRDTLIQPQRYILETWNTKLWLSNLQTVKESLSKLQADYAPLYAISQLRFPSPVGRGGHDFYHNGKVTNRNETAKGDARDE